ncbi:hypothetical protein A1356_11260 [Methylomonas koyamae]|uniref:Uncharacterized protein n=2 Tax=Methylomonas koyamae TaxID=702114 RepID=A0AA91DDY0_9GAMM|nr:hypothetical protein A1356_11260 [Methylomonas koyamae]
MRKQIICWVLLGTTCNAVPAMACTQMQVLPSPKVAKGAMMTLVCKTDIDVKQVAAEIAGQEWNAALPNLYDDGSHGDSAANDKAYSLALTAPTVSGTYRVKFYRILPDQNELESQLLTFEVQ